ncbi:MAG: UDP-N-acetylmuramate dehydrogenase [Geoalkalibacter sp.]|jgi:UDP-N-acetylmuramate dehydrogenase|uniref:UDP-N-acetylmuramate dehydrogenase n=1 Tax=Geoalkalibacter sp. TaxID=3041440 RepID=UPI002A9B5592|nr:UDP-N-acetylmuramate dehydrogenase [Thermodesulfobacteriota bacterium]
MVSYPPTGDSADSTLVRLDVGAIRTDEPLSRHCSWRIGGPTDLFVEPADTNQIARLMEFAHNKGIPLLIMGEGSNLLFDDGGVRGIVLKIGRRLGRISIHDRTIVAEGGAWVPQLARRAARAGLTGLEHIIGIPGTIGGLVMMNGGSHRQAIGDHVRRVWIIDRTGNERVLTREECRFDYRRSALQGTGAAVTRVELTCPVGDTREIRRRMIEDLRERRHKFPRKQPNCGSVFLSSPAMHAQVGPPGKIIEDAGLKGMRIGGAEVSRLHANFIVNRGGASCRDVLELIHHIRAVVRQKIDFDLKCEVRYVSPQAVLMPADQALHLVAVHAPSLRDADRR